MEGKPDQLDELLKYRGELKDQVQRSISRRRHQDLGGLARWSPFKVATGQASVNGYGDHKVMMKWIEPRKSQQVMELNA
jgi:hypothetical protein